jgi:hypothetical protein
MRRLTWLLVMLLPVWASAQGRYFGSVGLDARCLSYGALYPADWDKGYSPLDVSFRAGYYVLPELAVCSELMLVRTFPDKTSFFLSTPSFRFLPGVRYDIPFRKGLLFYVGNATGVTHFSYRSIAWCWKSVLGVEWQTPRVPLRVGFEAGLSYDAIGRDSVPADLGGMVNLGLRITGVAR